MRWNKAGNNIREIMKSVSIKDVVIKRSTNKMK